mgnify:FL=1
MSVEGVEDLQSAIAAAQALTENLTPIVHKAIIEQFKRRSRDIPISKPRGGHVPGALLKSLTRPNDRLHHMEVRYFAGRLDIEVGSKYRGARFQIKRIPTPVAARILAAVTRAYRSAIEVGLLEDGDIIGVRKVSKFGRREHIRLSRRARHG